MIVVTTPTGQIGSRLTELLLARGEAIRVIARDPSGLSPTLKEGAEVIAGSHADAAVLDAALAGTDAFFFLVPPNSTVDSVSDHYLDYARQARAAIERNVVSHVVAISTMGDSDGPAGHLSAGRAAEAELAESGAAVRAISPPFFMENLLRQIEALRGGVLALPSDTERVLPVVATDDLAALAADLLVDRSWDGVGRVPISSSDSLTPTGISAVIGEALGREVAYRQLPIEEYGEMLRGFGFSESWADGITTMAVAQNAGFYDAEMDTARGLAPTTFAAWCATTLRPAIDAGGGT